MKAQVKISEVQGNMGSIVASYRKKEKLTQGELAERIGASRPTISNIENGRGASTAIILKIFKYFGVLQDLNSCYVEMLNSIEEEKRLRGLDLYG